MYLAIIILPLLGSIVSGFFGRKIGVTGSQLITCTCVITTTILSALAFVEVGVSNIPVHVQLFRWIDSESLNILWEFHFDSLTVSMLIPVLIVSSLVHVYSIGYMSHDPHNQRFFSYLSLFTFMMIILVTASNYLLMFVGWEGVGVCSYLLVSFWFTRIAANQSSVSAFLTNRVGDCFLTIGMFAILWSFGSVEYSTVFSTTPLINSNIITLVGICLLIGAMAKSSQIGLHIWLPMAMEGPTPVSALIHAATMVTAGVYLLMRSSPLIEYSNTVLLLCLWVGAVTTVFSSLIGLFQQDIKKVIAYSTMSQLGMMVIAIGISCYNVALFHLVNHAFYKGLLFLGAGAVIHSVADNQDFRKYGGLKQFLPLTYSVMLIASLSLIAFPFMTGFYSKDFILESTYGQFYFSSIVVYFVASIAAMFTTLYSVKVLYLTFLANPNGPLVNYKYAHEGDIFMSLPLILLAFFSVFFGYITKDIFTGLGSNFFTDNSLFVHPSHEIILDTEFAVPTAFKILPLILTLCLSVMSIIFSEFINKPLVKFKLSDIGYNVYGFFNQRLLIELFYNKYITNFVLKLGGQTTKVIDKGSIELVGPYGLEKGLVNLSEKIARLDTGVVTSQALYILVGLSFYILIPYLCTVDNNLLIIILFGLLALNPEQNNTIKSYTSVLSHQPPKPHAFIKSPVESSFLYKSNLHHLDGDRNTINPEVVKAKGNYLYLKDGRKVFDAAGGAAVICLGRGNKRIINTITKTLKEGTSYLPSPYWSHEIVNNFRKKLILSTNKVMSKVYLTGSGSEANEAALKLARQFFFEQDKNTTREKYIARDRSYHGNTIGALSVSGFHSRRRPYFSILGNNVHFVSYCNPYRQQLEGETTEEFVRKKAHELENKFQELGPDTVIGFIMEPVSGAALGCVPFVKGYLKAMQDVCHKHGALVILDEVMCGTGRTGTLHAWQKEKGVTPDIHTMGKGLGAGHFPIAAVMASERVIRGMKKSPYVHGQTYDSMPVQAAVGSEVLSIIEEKNLLDSVTLKGIYLGKRLHAALSDHPNVGDIRGAGLFWGIEFVKNKFTKEPLNLELAVSAMIMKMALVSPYNMTVYPGTGTFDGVRGDHIMLSPSYLITKKEIDHIVNVVSLVVTKVFNTINTE